jgi:hypothetical protein
MFSIIQLALPEGDMAPSASKSPLQRLRARLQGLEGGGTGGALPLRTPEDAVALINSGVEDEDRKTRLYSKFRMVCWTNSSESSPAGGWRSCGCGACACLHWMG